MKKNKLLVIFFLSCISSYIIYKETIDDRINVLIIGDNYLLNNGDKTYNMFFSENYYNINEINTLFLFENVSYDQLISNIKDNYFIFEKGKKIFLNQKIKEADIIIVNANNSEYFKKCYKGNNILLNYDKKISKQINELKTIIKKFCSSKVIVISNYCNNINYNVNNGDINFNNIFYRYKVNDNKHLNNKMHFYIFNEISKYVR